MTHFRIIPDFDNQSARGPKCYITGLSKQRKDPSRPQQQEHEIDEFILRGPAIDFEGYMDIRPAVIRETAQDLLGMITKSQAAALLSRAIDAETALALANERADTNQARLEDMILANAEQIVQISALGDELEQAYADLYAEDDDQALEDA